MVVVKCVSDSDDSDSFEWDSDGNEEDAAIFNAAGAGSSAVRSTNTGAPGPSTRVANGNGKAGPSTSLVQKYVDMGFTEEIVLKAMKDNGDNGADSLVELLLTYQELGNDLKVDNGFASGCVPQTVDDSDDDDILENWDDEDAGGRSTRVANSDDSGDEDFLHEMSQTDDKISSLVEMGFPEDEAALAITRCGQDASISVLVDSIYKYCGNLSDYEDNSVARSGAATPCRALFASMVVVPQLIARRVSKEVNAASREEQSLMRDRAAGRSPARSQQRFFSSTE